MPLTTMALFGNHVRPDWAGPVAISDYQPASLFGAPLRADHNPRTVMGIVVPVATGGRPQAPEAYSGFVTGRAQGTDRGHLMGLELGGPDIPENIAPQSSLWQQSGDWRRLEREVVGMALEVMKWTTVTPAASAYRTVAPGRTLFFRVCPYPEMDQRGEPQSYIATATVVRPYQDVANRWSYEAIRTMSMTRTFTICPPTNASNGK